MNNGVQADRTKDSESGITVSENGRVQSLEVSVKSKLLCEDGGETQGSRKLWETLLYQGLRLQRCVCSGCQHREDRPWKKTGKLTDSRSMTEMFSPEAKRWVSLSHGCYCAQVDNKRWVEEKDYNQGFAAFRE